MTFDQLATVQRQLAELSQLALEIEGLDDFIAAVAVAPVADADDLRALAIAVAGLQRVIVEQLDAQVAEASDA